MWSRTVFCMQKLCTLVKQYLHPDRVIGCRSTSKRKRWNRASTQSCPGPRGGLPLTFAAKLFLTSQVAIRKEVGRPNVQICRVAAIAFGTDLRRVCLGQSASLHGVKCSNLSSLASLKRSHMFSLLKNHGKVRCMLEDLVSL